MKKLFVIILLLFTFKTVLAQEEIKLSDLKTPNSPGFQLLDISPSSVERPTNPKEFSLKVLNLTGSGSSIPKNFAFEFSPFWYFKPKKQSVYKYLGVKEIGSNKFITGSLSTGFLQKANISLASAYSDSTSGSLLKNTNYIAFGVKTNLITFRAKKQNEKLSNSILNIAKRMSDFQDGHLTLEEIEKGLDNDSAFKENMHIVSQLPLVQLDAAYAYSDAFRDNKFDNRRFNRWGVWATLAVNADFKNKKQINHSLSFIFLIKSLNDNVLNDTAKNVFVKDNSLDLGGKIEYNISKFSISIEYLKRTYDSDNLNSERTVGLLQYKISDNLYLLGTYGKNFGNFNNVFTVLGLNWGFGSSPLSLDDK